MSCPNQKVVQIGKRIKRNKENLFATMNLDALREAMRNLKGSSLKLWLYFNKNQEQFKFELSRADCLEWGIKKDSYYSAVEDLIDKGYLIPMRNGSNIYTFWETPSSAKKTNCSSEKEIIDWENQNCESENKIAQSEKLERNNTNNTRIIQNKKMASNFSRSSQTTIDYDEPLPKFREDLGF